MTLAYWRSAVVIACGIALTGCSSDWQDTTDRARGWFEAHIDSTECIHKAHLPPTPAVSEDMNDALIRYRICMRDRGWRPSNI
jgi:hypothetical protein